MQSQKIGLPRSSIDECPRSEGFMGSFLTGLALGFGLGIFFAPMAGGEMRDMIAERANQTIEKGTSVAQRVQSAAREISRPASEATKGEVSDALSSANRKT
jgi:gas vesicle protein